MTDDLVKHYRNSREWLNDGECCGDKDSDGVCAAPACIFGEAVKELQNAADRIEQLDASSEGWKEIADEYFDAICERNTRIEKLEEQIHYATGVAQTNIAGRLYAEDRVRELEAALKPFLQLPIGVEAKDSAEMEVYQCHGWPGDESAVVTVADFQRARKALKEKNPLEWTENYGQGSEPWLKDVKNG